MNKYLATVLASASVSSFLVVILYAVYLATGNRPFFTNFDMALATAIGGFCAILLFIGSMDD